MPWILVGLIVLLVLLGFLAYVANQPSSLAVSATATPTAGALRAASPSPTSLPTATPAATSTALPTATSAPTSPPTVAATHAPAPPSTPGQAASAPSATAFSGQVAGAGGLGNTRADLQAAYGAPVGETPDHLVVFRKDPVEYHVDFAPDPNGRAVLIVAVPGAQQQPWTQDAAMAEARKLLPLDAQPPSAPAEGNNEFVAQRFTSQSLARALGDQPVAAAQAQPGDFLVVYARDPSSGRITRFVVGVGDDPSALLNRGR
jgi:hypothetical protein